MNDPYTSPLWADIPAHMRLGLRNYVEHRLSPGHFLTAVLSNDLREAVTRADRVNIRALAAYVRWLTTYAPAVCWGSHERVDVWLHGDAA